MSTDGLTVTIEGGVLSLLLDAPARRNALSPGAIVAMRDALATAQFDARVRVVVITGAGADFCTGADLGASATRDDDKRAGRQFRRMESESHALIRAIRSCQVPVVAGVRGWAVGLGCGLALACDIVLADETATFWVPFLQRGMSPDSGTTYLLTQLVGMARAKDMVLRGRKVGGPLAQQWGMIADCVPAEQFSSALADIAAGLAAAPTIAAGLGKWSINRATEGTLADALERESLVEEIAVRTNDFREGMKAFREHRDPKFTGR